MAHPLYSKAAKQVDPHIDEAEFKAAAKHAHDQFIGRSRESSTSARSTGGHTRRRRTASATDDLLGRG